MSFSARASQMRRAVVLCPKATTSIGSKNFPRNFTCLAASAMTTQLRDASQTSFSRNRAAPAPLISDRPGPISSAPSTVRSMVLVSPNSPRRMPRLAASSAVEIEVGTPRISMFRAASALTNQTAVEPVPRPTTMPGSTRAAAASPAARFWASVSMGGLRRGVFPPLHGEGGRRGAADGWGSPGAARPTPLALRRVDPPREGEGNGPRDHHPFAALRAVMAVRKRAAQPGFSSWGQRSNARASGATSLVITDPEPM